MKILFVVQGEGRGHFTQALSLKRILEKNGHTVVGVMVGKSPSRKLPAFFTEKIKIPLYPFESPNFLPSVKNKQANILQSVLYNLLKLPVYLRSIYLIRKTITDSGADLVVNFYELLTGLTYGFAEPDVPYICVAHQYLFLHSEFRFPDVSKVKLKFLLFFTRLTCLRASRLLALSFKPMSAEPDKKLLVVPPLLREEVLHISVSNGNYLHGYMVNSGFCEEVKFWHEKNPKVSLHFFWDKKGVESETRIDDCLSFHLLNDTAFLQYMSGCKGYATTAGFESVCEAMYLGKPVLMVPAHIEQMCNAYDAVLAGAGIQAVSFDLELLVNYISEYRQNVLFRWWVGCAEHSFGHAVKDVMWETNFRMQPVFG